MTTTIMALLITSLLFSISILSNINNKDKEKLFPFECGFNPMTPPKTPFSIQFFKILLIFLMFDMEIIVVLPLPLNTLIPTMYMMISITLIMLILIMGLLFEWKEGSLQWLK